MSEDQQGLPVEMVHSISLYRRPRRRRAVYTRPSRAGRLLLAALFIAVMLVGSGYYYYAMTLVDRLPCAIEVNEKRLVVARSQTEALRAIGIIRQRYAPAVPEVVQFMEGDLRIRPLPGWRQGLRAQEAAEVLDRRLTVALDGYAIFVNGAPLALLASTDAAAEAVSLMMERGMRGRRGLPTFKERIIVDHLRIEEDSKLNPPVVTPREAAVMLVRSPQPRVHIVELGDNFWQIARDNGITIDDLIALNPGLDYRALRVGDRVKLPDSLSPVTVVVKAAPAPMPSDAGVTR